MSGFDLTDLFSALNDVEQTMEVKKQAIERKKQELAAKKAALLAHRQRLLDLAQDGRCRMTRAMAANLAARGTPMDLDDHQMNLITGELGATNAQIANLQNADDILAQMLASFGIQGGAKKGRGKPRSAPKKAKAAPKKK